MNTRTTREPRVGDIWLAHYPYSTPGNMQKVRPVIILGFTEDDIVVQKLTSKKKHNKPFNHPKMNRPTYYTHEKCNIPEYNLIRYLGKI